ncbi:MAG: hypothetical protein AAGK78_11110 [Planctomycetota bacterium]
MAIDLVSDVFTVIAAADVQRHESNRASFENIEEIFGSRTEVGGAVGVRARWSPAWSCGLSGHVPVWQQADGVQLVEVVSVRVDCGYSAIE